MINTNNTETLSQISKKLSVLIALSLKNKDTESDTSNDIKFLGSFGFSNEEIAEILSTSKNYVAVTKSKSKSKLKNKNKNK